MASDDPAGTRPSPVVLRIKLRYDDVEAMTERFAPNVGRSGFFLPTRSMQPLGTEVKFELRLANDQPVLVGLGRVKSAREPDRDNPAAAYGLGLELMRVTREGRELILKLLARRRQLGLPEVALPTAEEVDDAHRAAEVAAPEAAAAVAPKQAAAAVAPRPEAAVAPRPEAAVAPRPEAAVNPRPAAAAVARRPEAAVAPRPETGAAAAPMLTAPRQTTGPISIPKAAAIQPLPAEPPRRKRRPMSELVESAPGAVATSLSIPGLDEDVDVGKVLARARALATGDLDQELEQLRDEVAAPLAEISIEEASVELARQLGGIAVRRDRSQGWAPPPIVEPRTEEAVEARAEEAVEPKTEEAAEQARADAAAEQARADAAAEQARADAAAEQARADAEAQGVVAEAATATAGINDPAPVAGAFAPQARFATEAPFAEAAGGETAVEEPVAEAPAGEAPALEASPAETAVTSAAEEAAAAAPPAEDFADQATLAGLTQKESARLRPAGQRRRFGPSNADQVSTVQIASLALAAHDLEVTQFARAIPEADDADAEDRADADERSGSEARPGVEPADVDTEHTHIGSLPVDPRMFGEPAPVAAEAAGLAARDAAVEAAALAAHDAAVEAGADEAAAGAEELGFGVPPAEAFGAEPVAHSPFADGDGTIMTFPAPDVEPLPPPPLTEVAALQPPEEEEEEEDIEEIEEIDEFEILSEADAADPALLAAFGERDLGAVAEAPPAEAPPARPSDSDFASRLDLGDDNDVDSSAPSAAHERAPLTLDSRELSAGHALAALEGADAPDEFDEPHAPRAVHRPGEPRPGSQPPRDPAQEFSSHHVDFPPQHQFDQSDVFELPQALRPPRPSASPAEASMEDSIDAALQNLDVDRDAPSAKQGPTESPASSGHPTGAGRIPRPSSSAPSGRGSRPRSEDGILINFDDDDDEDDAGR